jgi:hypothetical protein
VPTTQTIWPAIDRSLRENLVIISGHGSWYKSSTDRGARLKVKQGITVTLWQPLGGAMDDGTVGQWLDRGCTVTALSKQRSQNRPVVTYQPGDCIPNLILTQSGRLNIRTNQAGDAHCVFPNFGLAIGNRREFIVQTAAVITVNGIQSTSLFHIVEYALANNLGTNFQWAACTSTITQRERWFAEKTSVSMIVVADQLYQLTNQDPAYEAWK